MTSKTEYHHTELSLSAPALFLHSRLIHRPMNAGFIDIRGKISHEAFLSESGNLWYNKVISLNLLNHTELISVKRRKSKMIEKLRTLPYWDKLTENERILAEQSAYVRHYKAKEQLYGPCVDCVGMIHILKGEARAYLLSDEGREITLFNVEESDNCILSASCVLAHLSFEAHMATTKSSDILIIPVSLFGDFCNNNIHVRCFAYELAAKRFSSVVSVMEQTLFARLDKRLAGLLLLMYKETGNPEILVTQGQLALKINSVRETVGRTLKKFAEDGMIEIRRGTIQLKNIAKLEKAAK